MVGHPEQRRMNDSMQRGFYGPHMSNNVYTAVSCNNSCARNRVNLILRRRLQLLYQTVCLHSLPSIFSDRSTVCQIKAPTRSSWLTKTQSPHDLCQPKNVFCSHSKCFLWHQDSLVWQTCLRCNGQRCADLEQVVRLAVNHTWCETPDNNNVPPSNKWPDRTVQSNGRHLTAPLCCQKPVILGQTSSL